MGKVTSRLTDQGITVIEKEYSYIVPDYFSDDTM